MPAVISSSLNSTAANHQAQVNKKTHTAEQGPDARSNTGYANTRDYALYKAEPTDGNMSHAAKQGSRCSFPADTELCEYKRLRPLQDGTTDGNMSHTTEPDILLYIENTIGDMKAEFSKSPHLYRSQHRRKPNKAKQKHESGVFRRKHLDSCLLESKRNAYLYPKPFEAA